MEKLSRRSFVTGAAGALAALGMAACGAQQAAEDATTEEETQGSTPVEEEAVATEEAPTEAAATGISAPIVTELAYRTYQISEFGMDSLFWIEGDDRAVLLDTGTGTFDIPAFIDATFGPDHKPYDVVLTHGHVDHASGMFQFDKVYLHEADWELALGNTQEERAGYVQMMLDNSGPGLYTVTPDDIIGGEDPETDSPELLALNEGDMFDLGGRTLEVYFTPGHTAGSCSFLDRKNRIMFTGDACNQNTLLTPFGGAGEDEVSADQCISGLKASAEKLLSLQDAYDRNINGHVGWGPYLSFTSQSPLVIPECVQLCQDILDGTVEGVEQPGMFGGSNFVAQSETGAMQIQYLDWQVK